jgi:hypothetical protein
LAGQRRGIDQRGQPPPPRVGVDCRQRDVGIGDAQQVIEEQHVIRLGVGHPGPHLRAGFRGIQIGHPEARTQHPPHQIERDVARVRFAEGGEHVDTTGRCHGGDLARQTALADAG